DHLGIYGYRRDTSPALAAFARESLLFTAARSQAACTFPSVNSILTSRFPSAFMGQSGGAMGLPAGIPGVAEILRGKGFHTVAISASPVVRKSPTRFNPGGGYDRGFEVFDEQCLWQPADCVTRQALPHLRRGARPLLLYLHYLDPHGPYALPPRYPHRFATGTPRKDFIRRGDPNPIANHLYKGGPDPGVTAADIEYLVDLYDDKIAFFDSQLARLLRAVRASGLLDESIVVFAADHGEEFLEHGHVKHCRTLFDTSVHTPLLVRLPGVGGGAPLTAPVQNLDIVPTLLDYLGIAKGGLPLAGHSLRPLIEGERGHWDRAGSRDEGGGRGGEGERAGNVGGARHPGPSFQFASQGALRSVSDGRWKLIQNLASHRFALFDLAADPGERRDCAAAHRPELHRLRQALDEWLARTEGTAAAGALRSTEADRKLRSVGYLD
nr:sulfatase-like hydrolase/transferase [Acidobacteriota bacterium]